MVEPVKSEFVGGLFLPPGFRLHPTDAEVILSYLLQKFLNPSFTSLPIGEVDLNKCEPWDLPSKAKMGEKEWYFFCNKDMKYPTGMRTSRATKKGYWKATGKDREIFRPAIYEGSSKNNKQLVGMKKTLVFYMGRAPKGTKTNWVMHEFRLHDNLHNHHPNLRHNIPRTNGLCERCSTRSRETKPSTTSSNHSLPLISALPEHPTASTPSFKPTTTSSPIPASTTSATHLPTSCRRRPICNNNAAVYSSVSASTTTSFQQQPNCYSAPLQQHVSSWNNTPGAGGAHGNGSSYYNLQQQQQQAAMVKDLEDIIAVPDYGTLLPSSNKGSSIRSATAGVSQQNPLGVPQYKIDQNYGDHYISRE